MSRELGRVKNSYGWAQEDSLFDARAFPAQQYGHSVALDSAVEEYGLNLESLGASHIWPLQDKQFGDWDHHTPEVNKASLWEVELRGLAAIYNEKAERMNWGELLVPVAVAEEPIAKETYRGKIRAVMGSKVLVEVDSPDDPDIHEAYIPLASFSRTPETGDDFRCEMITRGAVTITQADLVSRTSLPSLANFGIDERELLEWAASLEDV